MHTQHSALEFSITQAWHANTKAMCTKHLTLQMCYISTYGTLKYPIIDNDTSCTKLLSKGKKVSYMWLASIYTSSISSTLRSRSQGLILTLDTVCQVAHKNCIFWMQKWSWWLYGGSMSKSVGYLWAAIEIPCYFHENGGFEFWPKISVTLWQEVYGCL